jgi:hypothetical protein
MAAPTSPDVQSLKAELEAALMAAVERLGPDGLVKAAIVKPLLNRGVHQATLYRWFDAIIASGKPGQHAARKVKEAVAERAARAPEPKAAVAKEVESLLPVVVQLEDVTAGGGKTTNVLERLARVTEDVELLVKHAKTEDGKVRNSRLLLSAAGELRKCLETSVKFYQAMREVENVDRLHATIVEEIRRESPEVAERILRRMRAVAAAWVG